MQSNADDLVSKLVDDDGKQPNGGGLSEANGLSGQTSVNPPAGFMPLQKPPEVNEQWYYTDPQKKVQGPFLASHMATWCAAGYFSDDLLVRKEGEEKWSKLGDLIAMLRTNPFLPENNVAMQKPQLSEAQNAEIIERARLKRELEIYEALYQKYIIEKQEYDQKFLDRQNRVALELSAMEGFQALPPTTQQTYFQMKLKNLMPPLLEPQEPQKPFAAILLQQQSGSLLQKPGVSELPPASGVQAQTNSNLTSSVNSTNNTTGVMSQIFQQQFIEKELLQQRQQSLLNQGNIDMSSVLSQLSLNPSVAAGSNAALLEMQQKQLQQMVGSGGSLQLPAASDSSVQPVAADPIRDLVQQMNVSQKNGLGLSGSMSCSNLQQQQLLEQPGLQQPLLSVQQPHSSSLFLSHSKSMASLPALYEQQLQHQKEQQPQLQQPQPQDSLQELLKQLPASASSNNISAATSQPQQQQQQQRPGSAESQTSSSLYSEDSSSSSSAAKQPEKEAAEEDSSNTIASLMETISIMQQQKQHQQTTIQQQAQLLEQQRAAQAAKEEEERRRAEEAARVRREREAALVRRRQAEEEQARVRAELKRKQEEEEKKKLAAAEAKRKKEEEKLKNKPKSMEEANKRAEEKRRAAEAEARRKEEKRLTQEAAKAAKAAKKAAAEAEAAKKAAWGASQPPASQQPSMSDIQRRQLEQEKAARDAASREAEEARRVEAPAAGWGARGPGQVKSITQIQQEEGRRKRQAKEDAPKAAPAPPRAAPAASWAAKIAPPSAKPWGEPQPAPAAPPAGFWDAAPRPLAASVSAARLPAAPAPAAPRLPRAASAAQLPAPKQTKSAGKKAAGDEDLGSSLKAWARGAVAKLPRCNSAVDVATLVDILLATESPYEVHDYVRSYVGDTSAHKTFVRTFLERRSTLRATVRARAVGTDDITAPAKAVNPTDAPLETKKNQKKGKKKMQKADSSMLGFNSGH